MHRAFSEKRFDSVTSCNEQIRYFEMHNEPKMAKCMTRYRDRCWAGLIFLAREEKAVDRIPDEFRMPLCPMDAADDEKLFALMREQGLIK